MPEFLKHIRYVYRILIPVVSILSFSLSQTNEECVMCHGDPGIEPLFLDQDQFSKSVHGDFQCVDCHVGFDPFALPHADPIEIIECQMCHDVPDFKKSIHAMSLSAGKPEAPQCQDCHTTHYIRPSFEQRNNTGSCISCHGEKHVVDFIKSAHARIGHDGSLAASCVDCHGGHEIVSVTSPDSPVAKGNVQERCGVCHGDVKRIEETSIHGRYFLDGLEIAPSCVNCHPMHDVSMDRFVREQNTCLQCHMTEEFAGLFGPRSREFMEIYEHSIHYLAIEEGKMSASCSDCHGSHNVYPADDIRSTVHRSAVARTCARCHGQSFADFRRSVHGEAWALGVEYAPTCSDCHGEHSIVTITSEDSPISRKREAETCLKCHLDDPEVRDRVPVTAGFIGAYSESVHGMALKAGKLNAATCSDCHGSHEILDPYHPTSKINQRNVNKTCGTCHGDIYEEYIRSSHGIAFLKGVRDAPNCTDCHGEHTIYPHDDPRSPVSAVRLATEVCAPCHESVRLTERYGLPAGRLRSFVDSYHGLAMRAGGVEAANCASCHGAHNILPSNNPDSKVHPANIAATCGSCHPGATENFARGRIHYMGDSNEEPWIIWISSIYIVLIVTTVGGMLFHNLFDYYRKAKNKLTERRRGLGEQYTGRGLYLRMTLSERIQHGSLMISFPLLVITGFMLSYPDAWWVIPFREYFPWFYEFRSLLHRIAGVVMIAGSVYHLYYIIFTSRGRELVKDLMPKIQDLYDAIGVMKYNMGISTKKPKMDRFGYVEKLEYWALVWGAIIMILTGFVLWFETTFINMTSLLFHDVMRTIHFFEAWLATLAIIIWHFYFVIFNPDVYPMNLAWLKGTLTEEEMKHEHPLELERIKKGAAKKESEEKLVSNDVDKETIKTNRGS